MSIELATYRSFSESFSRLVVVSLKNTHISESKESIYQKAMALKRRI